jgi:serine/threonine protein kinase
VTFKTDFSGQHFLPMGSCIAEFEIKGLIGEGGFGTVYLAFDHSLLRTVALKEFLPTTLAQRGDSLRVMLRSERKRETFEAGMKSFINEARLLAQFDHPALVKVYRFWEANNTAYMVMPFYEGISLKQLVYEHPEKITEHYLMGMLPPLLDALEHLHQMQIYHRDIAPDNIMILESGMPVLLDFGAARRVITDMTQALTIILKPGFAPIEQYADDASLKQGSWTDIYALCSVLYYSILCKAPPTAVSRMVKDTMQPLANNPLLANYSQSFLNAIDAGLAVSPQDRIQTTEQFRHRIGLRTFILPGTNPPPITTSGREGLEIPQQGAKLAVNELGLSATSLSSMQPPIPAEFLPEIPATTSNRSTSTEGGQTAQFSQRWNEKLQEAQNPDQTTIVFNSSASFTKAGSSSRIEDWPVPEELMATRILHPDAVRKVIEAELEEARKKELGINSNSSGIITSASPPVTNVDDFTTRILSQAETIPKIGQPCNKPAANKPSITKIVKAQSNLSKSGTTKTKSPDLLIKLASKRAAQTKLPVLAITFGVAGLIALAGVIWVVTMQISGKKNTPTSASVVIAAPASQLPVGVGPAQAPTAPAMADTVKPSPSSSGTPVTSVVPVISEVSPTVEQATGQISAVTPAQEAQTQESNFPDKGKAALSEELPKPKNSLPEEVKPLPGKVQLTVKPWGSVTIGGISRGVSPPLKTLTLPEGQYAVKIENPGFTPFITTIDVKRGKTLPLRHTFSHARGTKTP